MKALVSITLVACLATSATTAAVPVAEQSWRLGNYQKAFLQAIEAAENGDEDAQFLIGEAYRLGKGTSENLLMADVWYFRAANSGHVQAAARLGEICVAEHRTEDARRWLSFAADHGDVGALGALAALLYNAPEGEQDRVTAFALMARAAAAGSEQAKVQLARMGGESNLAVAMASPSTPPQTAPKQRTSAAPAPVATSASPPMAVAVAAAVAVSLPSAGGEMPASFVPNKRAVPRRARLAESGAPRRALSSAVWRVQVGAFSSTAAAHNAWARLTAQMPSLRKNTLFLSQAGPLVRVQTTARSRTDALALCHSIHAADWACFVKPGPSLRKATLAVNFRKPSLAAPANS